MTPGEFALIFATSLGVVGSIGDPFRTLWRAASGLGYVTRATWLGFAGVASF